MEKYCSLKC